MLGWDSLICEYLGIGLGLFIVKEFCCFLDGEIMIESEFGKGSIFMVIVFWEFSELLICSIDFLMRFDELIKLKWVDFEKNWWFFNEKMVEVDELIYELIVC